MTLEEQINKIISQHWVHLEHDEIIAELTAFVQKLVKEKEQVAREEAVGNFWLAVCNTMYQRIPKEKVDEVVRVVQHAMYPSGMKRE